MYDGQKELAETVLPHSPRALRLLIVEESASGAQALIDPLRAAGYAVTAARVKSPLEFQGALKKQDWDLVLFAVQLATFPAKQAIALLHHAKRDVPLIALRDDVSELELTATLQDGVSAVVKKHSNLHLQIAIERELRDLAHRRALHHYERMLHDSERRCRALAADSPQAVAYLRAGKLVYTNTALATLLEPGADSVASLTALIHADDRQNFADLIKRTGHASAGSERIDLRMVNNDGQIVKTTLEAAPAHLDGDPALQVIFALGNSRSAPSSRSDTQGTVAVLDATDFLVAADAALQTGSGMLPALAYLEIDNVEALQRTAGTALLTLIGDDITAAVGAVGKTAGVTRPSTHSVAVLLTHSAADAAQRHLTALCEEVAGRKWQQSGHDVTVTISAGLCVSTPGTKQGHAMLTEAAAACQLAKRAGGNRVMRAGPPTPEAPSAQELATRQRIRDALAADRFRMVYQPIVNLHAQPFECYDVLMRMIDENGKDVLPGEFMPTAEKAGLMTALDRWVIHAAMHTLAQQRARGKDTSFIIKLADDTLRDQALLPWLAAQLQELHLPGESVIFEIKEACVSRNPAVVKQFVDGVKALRCRSVLGHFGADPHSLEHLATLRVDFVKLAGSFVDKLAGDAKEEMMIKTVVQAAHDMGALTIATFVQEASKMTALWQCNVDYIQGYFLQAPDQDLSFDFTDQ